MNHFPCQTDGVRERGQVGMGRQALKDARLDGGVWQGISVDNRMGRGQAPDIADMIRYTG